MPVICCAVNMFDTSQTIIIANEAGEPLQKVNMFNWALGNEIANACSIYKTPKVHLWGPVDYVEGIVKDIEHCYHAKYSAFEKLEIEVN